MTKNSTVVPLRQPEVVDDPLTAVLYGRIALELIALKPDRFRTRVNYRAIIVS
jgi:hypothetical protein